MEQKTYSLEDLNATKASSDAFEFEYLHPDTGEGTGIFLSVLGDQSETVSSEVARLVNERRRKQAAREAVSKVGVGRKEANFETLESDVEFGQRLAAVRLVGWRGISDPWSAENALRLCKGNRDIAAAVVQQSGILGNFIKL